MRSIAILLLLAALAPAASASSSPDPILASPADAAGSLLAYATGHGDPVEVLRAQLAHQDGSTDEMAAAAQLPRPPNVIYRDVKPACDIDGDGVADLIVNNLTLTSPPGHARAGSTLEALSGRTGARLWKIDNLVYASMPAPRTVPYGTRGQADPSLGDNDRPFMDLDGDGTCDLVAYGLDSEPGVSVPLVNTPSVSHSLFVLRAISGKTGKDIWRSSYESTTVTADDPLFGTASNVVTRNFPTGLLTYVDASGAHVVVKVTDLRYHFGDAPVAVPPIPGLPPQTKVMQGPPHAEDVRITEHIQALDPKSGAVSWQRDLGGESADARYTNLTWFAGPAPLRSAGADDLVLDQMEIATPRTTEANSPATGETLFRYGRGVRVTALDGSKGDTLWSTTLLDPLAAQANVQEEENFETLGWTRSTVFPDLDHDGAPDIISTYVTQEESQATTIAGAFRTHVAPISGANGTALWNVRQQGWGVVKPLDAPVTKIGVGMLDVPTKPVSGARFPPKLVRLMALDAKDGAPVWTYEKSFAENSYLAYNLGLAQLNEALAPHDWNGDGVLDLVTPAEAAPRTERDQVLLATSTHSYAVLSGADGNEIGRVTAWGPDGRVLACGNDDHLTVLSGHARRLEVARYDPITGARDWRAVIHNDAAPRAASTAMDTVALGASCDARADGTLVSADLQAYSLDRRNEVIPILGLLQNDGRAAWLAPSVQGKPPSDAIVQASIQSKGPGTGALVATGAAATLVGAGIGIAAIVLLRRAGSALLAIGVVLLLLSPGALGLGVPIAHVGAPSPSPPPPPSPSVGTSTPRVDTQALAHAMAHATSPAEHVALVRTALLGAAYSNESLSRFEDNATISFTHPVGDIDGDGYGDLALDQYCVDGDACNSAIFIPQDTAAYATSYHCSYAHDLNVVSGRNGSILWSKDLTILGPVSTCGENFVLGTIPVNGTTAILVYRYQDDFVPGNEDGVVLHDIMAWSPKDGSVLWDYSAKGFYQSDLAAQAGGQTIIIEPIVSAPTPETARLTGKTQPSLMLEGIGWETSATNTIFPVVPGYGLTNSPVTLEDVYRPQEWAASLDLASGKELWHRDTFTPAVGKNVAPYVVAPFLNTNYDILDNERLANDRYWNAPGCCLDTTGDGVPDLVFRVYEWSPTPNGNVAGPHGLDVRLVILDGRTGATAIDQYVTKDMDLARSDQQFRRYETFTGLFMNTFAYQLQYEFIGDADGDGAADLLQHQILPGREFHQNISLVSGKTGKTLWSMDTVRDKRALVLGDADGDGGNDFLLLDWYGHEGGAQKFDDFATPGPIPLTMVSGRTGQTIWRATTYAAPADVLQTFRTIQRNGIADVDGDGVGDFYADDPIPLDDQTVVHDIKILSGRTGKPIRDLHAVGAFGMPAGASDLNGDGRDEIALLSGDVNDLWLTIHDGATGNALWSRRLLAMDAAGYAQALPYLKIQRLDSAAGPSIVVNFHLDVVREYTYIGTSCCANGLETGEFTDRYTATQPQIVQLGGADGKLQMALPKLGDNDRLATVRGATPGTIAFGTIEKEASPIGLLSVAGSSSAPYAIPAIGGAALGFAVVFAGGVALLRFRGRFEGVPELD